MKMKRLLSILLVLCMSVSLFTGVTFAASIVNSGRCGANVTWTLDSNGLLVISGTGAMMDFTPHTSSAAPWYSNRSQIKTVIIKDGVTNIGKNAFYSCDKLNSVETPNSVTVIMDDAFSGCDSLMSFVIPKGVTSIGKYVFMSCSSLTSVEIPESVTSIGYGAFSYCDVLNSITVDVENSNYSSLNGNLYNKDQTTLIQYAIGKKLTSFAIPNGVKSINNNAFYACGALTSVEIPKSVTSIGYGAFSYCDALTDVYYSGTTVDRREISLASDNDLLASATWHYNCTSENPTGESTMWKLDSDGVLTISCTGLMEDYTYPWRAPWYRNWYDIKSVIIENGVTSIEDDAFFSYSSLTSVMIPNSVTNIGNNAFFNCDGLTNVIIPDSVTTIGDSAFASCDGLTNVTIPNSVTMIGNGVFSNCAALSSVKLSDGVMSMGDDVFSYCESLTSVIIPKGVTSIGDNAFFNCDSLISITIPNSVMSIGSDAFYYCDALTDVYYAGSEADWEKISIGLYNTCLTNATIHFGSMPPQVNLSTINGAQIRTRGVQGIRFISTIDKTTADFSRVKEYGIVLIPSADITDISQLQIGKSYNGHAVAKVEAKKLYGETNTTITFTAVITGIPAARYLQEITARAYAIMDDGSVVYSDTSASRSIYAVAKRGLENPSESDANKAVFQTIVDAVDGV